MKASVFKSCIFIPVVMLVACGGQGNAPEKKKEILRLAYEHKDYTTAIVYTYEQYVQDYNQAYLLDSLFYLYTYSQNYVSASSVADKLIDNRKDDLRFIYTAATAYEQAENYAMAVSAYTRALELHSPDSLPITYNLAKCYLELGNYDASIQWAEKVLQMKDAEKTVLYIKESKATYAVGALNLIAMNYIRVKRYDEARDVLRTILQMAPFFTPAQTNLSKLNLLTEGTR